jgi:predicted DCC family thiol-disulfide oxidoreductase YuxK
MRDERAADAVQAVPEDVRFTTFHVIARDGSGFSGGAAVCATFASMRGTAWLGRALARMPLRPLVDLFYAALVKSKGVIGRLVPDAPGPERWP